MALEKEDLRVFKSPKNGQELAIRINPTYFKIEALREILRWQIFNDDGQKEITLLNEKNGRMAFIRNDEMQYARRHYFGDERRKFLDEKAAEMNKADNIIIRKISVNAELPPLKDILPSDKLHPLSKSVVSFLENLANIDSLK